MHDMEKSFTEISLSRAGTRKKMCVWTFFAHNFFAIFSIAVTHILYLDSDTCSIRMICQMQTIANIPAASPNKCAINSIFCPRWFRCFVFFFGSRSHVCVFVFIFHSHEAIHFHLIFHLKWMMCVCGCAPRCVCYSLIQSGFRHTAHPSTRVIISSQRERKKSPKRREKESCKHEQEHGLWKLLIEFRAHTHTCVTIWFCSFWGFFSQFSHQILLVFRALLINNTQTVHCFQWCPDTSILY